MLRKNSYGNCDDADHEHYMTATMIIFIGWEIVEDVVFPVIFIWLGNNVNPWFLTGAPISWIMCFHPIAVPVLWGIWIKFSGRKNESKDIEDQVCGPTCS